MTIDPNFKKNPPLILIVDDDKVLRLLLRRTMEQEGYRVSVAANGKEALDCTQTLKPDMVLLDAIMPEMDGFECCAQLQIVMGEECPTILMITALHDKASVDRAFKVGATDFVTKPIHWPVLLHRVRRMLASRWAIAQLQRQIEREHLLTEQLEAANRELLRLASSDALTQLANRRSFDEYLDKEWKRMAREQSPLSLILCDIDFFKAYNDTYGHPAGDECLSEIADVLRESAKRPADLVARYGGEEFALILPHTHSIGALELAESIRKTLKAQAIPHAGSPIANIITLSLGVASLVPTPESSPEKLIAAADTALYQAKNKGRDTSCLAG